MAYENKLETWWHGLPGEVQSVFGFAFDGVNGMLEAVAGDPDDLVRAGSVYLTLGPQITQIGTQLESDAKALGMSWQGDAFGAFVQKIDQLKTQLKNCGEATAATDEILRAAAQAAVDGANMIIDIFVTVIEFAIGSLVLALATSVISFGASMAAWVATQAAQAAMALSRVAAITAKVAQILVRVAEILQKIARILRTIAQMFKDWSAMVRAMKALPSSFTKAGIGAYISDQIVKMLITKATAATGVPLVPSGVTSGLPSIAGDLGDLHGDVQDAQSAG